MLRQRIDAADHFAPCCEERLRIDIFANAMVGVRAPRAGAIRAFSDKRPYLPSAGCDSTAV